MLKILLVTIFAVAASKQQLDPVADQLTIFKNKVKKPIGIITTPQGAPTDARYTGSTLNTELLDNDFFTETMMRLVHGRIPVRPAHQKGAGAFGYFETTHDVSHISKAEFLNKVGKKTPVAVRFSLSGTEKGGSDFTREPRGFAVKMYTKEGNMDFVGFNTPMFLFKDPNKFTASAIVGRKNAVTDAIDVNLLWDFLSINPETIFIFLKIFGDQGLPDGYRNMPGFPIHTYQFYNATGSIHHCRVHFIPCGEAKWLNSTVAASIAAKNPDYFTVGLYRDIANGNYPSWTVSLQILTPEDVKKATFDVNDITMILPEDQYPLHPIGKMVLNKNPRNYFTDVEQMAFCPGNLVPGILGAPDKAFQARRLFYREAQRSRLGVNFDKIPVNCPYRSKVVSYDRDGVPPVGNNGYDGPNYYPNSFNGPVPYNDSNRPSMIKHHEQLADNFKQAADYYNNQIHSEERSRIVENTVASLCPASNDMQDRVVKTFAKVHYDLSERVAKGLKEQQCKK